MDSRKYTCGILIDFKKAFDTVNGSILLAKLENYAITESNICVWGFRQKTQFKRFLVL